MARNLLCALAALVLLLTHPGPAQADRILSGPGIGSPFINPVGVPVQLIGFEFTVGSKPLLVTHLGTFDWDLDGLVGPEQVRLWKADGALLADVTVPAGTAAPLDGAFRFVDLAIPVLLTPGQSYILGTTNVADAYVADNAAQITPFLASEATFVQGRRNTGGGAFSGFAPDALARIGPNLIFTSMPEPGSLFVFGVAGAGLAGYLLRRNKRGRERRSQRV